MPLTAKQKEQLINNLISGVNGEGPWTEDDRLALNAIPEPKLEALEKQRLLALNASQQEDEEDEEDDSEDCDECPDVAPTKNQRKPATTKEWLKQAPPEIRSAVSNALKFERQQKAKLIEQITANERNQFSDEYLQSRELAELQGLAALCGNEEQSESSVLRRPDYSAVAPNLTANLGEDFAKEDLDMAPQPMSWK